METLEKHDYNKLTGPLKSVTINNLFARSVIEKHVEGRVLVDSVINPKTFYIYHPYGMSLLFGDHRNMEFNTKFRDYFLNKRSSGFKYEWLQTFPYNWYQVINELFGSKIIDSKEADTNSDDKVIKQTRINFQFNHSRYFKNRKAGNAEHKIIRVDKSIYFNMKGSVIPSNFWDSAEDFLERGVGFSLYKNNTLAATAFSAFVHDDMLELGIETVPRFRGEGLGHIACCALIDYCLRNFLEPVWACSLENAGSHRLALKLGFEPVARIPYYRINHQ